MLFRKFFSVITWVKFGIISTCSQRCQSISHIIGYHKMLGLLAIIDSPIGQSKMATTVGWLKCTMSCRISIFCRAEAQHEEAITVIANGIDCKTKADLIEA